MSREGLVGIVFNPRVAEARGLAEAIARKAGGEASTWVASATEVDLFEEAMKLTRIVVTVGGDGTILRTVRVAGPPGVPILGVNLGRVGFMTEVRAEEALAKLDFYLKGSPRVEERTMLHAVVSSRGGGGGEVGARQEESIHGLNDVVVGREAVARLTSVAARVDGVQLTTYRADGVIVSTATGSTGYLVSVGGPIVHPELPVLLLRPIAPHLGLDIPLVLAADSSVELTVGQGYRALASVDGFMDRSLAEGDSVTVRRSPYKARFLRANPASHFYTVLTRRLGWSPSPEGDREEP